MLALYSHRFSTTRPPENGETPEGFASTAATEDSQNSFTQVVSVDPTSSEDKCTIKRKKNTAAARRYGQGNTDRQQELKNTLEKALAPNARLKKQVALCKAMFDQCSERTGTGMRDRN